MIRFCASFFTFLSLLDGCELATLNSSFQRSSALAPCRRSLEGLGKDLLLGFVRGEACLKCAWGMSHPKQCRELTWGSSNCPSGHATLLLLLVLCCLLFCCSRFRRKPMVLPSSREPAVEKDV